MEGSLHTYDEGRRLVLFAHGWADHAVVFIGGLTDGFNATPYLGSLADGLRDGSSWFLVQLQIRSSFLGYGVHSLDEDAEDVESALRYLRVRGVRSLVVMGHSTGCQDIVHMMKHRNVEGLVAGCVLQAPVSDREFAATLPDTARSLELARAMRDQGNADELMPRDADEAPVTARRYLSLYDRGGGDDYFSSDLADDELRARLAGMRAPALLLASLGDEYVPSSVDTGALMGRLAACAPGPCQVCLLDGADHAVSAPPAAQKELVLRVVGFVSALA